MSVTRSWLQSPVSRLGAYGVLLVAVLGGGAALGATVGPDPSPAGTDAHMEGMEAGVGAHAAAVPAGLAVSQDGYTLQLQTPTLEPGDEAEVRFVIVGPDGHPLTAYDVEHDKELHLVTVSRDLASYAHVHPARDAHGTWRVAAPDLPAGSYRVYADFVPSGGERLTLASDLTVPGVVHPRPLPAPTSVAHVDGYDISLVGTLTTGATSELTVTVTRDGAPVTDLEPYLGALGHLVAIRDGDLAYLHVHPLEETTGPGGPAVRFAVEVPSAGTYGLYFDFAHGGDVHTASFVVTAVFGHEAEGE
jgi:hypothetical protein